MTSPKDAWGALAAKPPATRAALEADMRDFGWEIGEHTYGVPTFLEKGAAKLGIGKYTSIAEGVKIAFADHRTDTVSTYPFVALRAYWPSAPIDVSDHVSKGDVRIGNDVWLGADAMILSGVVIGDGAVVGAKSVVTQDVPSYAVVVGSPAKVMRYRFAESVIQRLLAIAWWHWTDEKVAAFLPLIVSTNIDAFLNRAQDEETGTPP